MRQRVFLGSLACLLAVSCSVHELDVKESLASSDDVFYTSLESYSDPATRVYVDENVKILWDSDDRISIFNKYTYNQEYRFAGATGSNAGAFKKVPTDDFVTGNDLEYVYAVYPYQEGTSISNSGVLSLELPANQEYRDGSFGLGSNTMVSVTEDNQLKFRNVGGYLVLKFYGAGVSVSSISLEGNNGELLSGQATVSQVVGGVPSLTMSSNAGTSVSLTCETPVELGSTKEEATQFWLVVPPTSFTKGFKLTVMASDGRRYVKETSANLSITRNGVLRISPIEVELSGTSNSNPMEAVYDFASDTFGFSCEGGELELLTTVEGMNVQVYNALKMSKDLFHATYDTFYPNFEAEGITNVGTVEEIVNSGVEGPHIMKWTITADEAWEYTGRKVRHLVTYHNSQNPRINVRILLEADVASIKTAYDIPISNYISNYWNADMTATRYNVAVPNFIGDEDPTNCVFVNDINASFVTWSYGDEGGVPGVIKVDPSVTGIQYFFCRDMMKITDVGPFSVKYTISEDGMALFATLDTVTEVIATIDNEGEEIPNTITLNKESDLAKQLLNTNQFYVFIGAKGFICGDEVREVTITFKGKDHFRADYIRPISVTSGVADCYIDGVDFGERGSYIVIDDLINVIDWRNRSFEDYENYWGFYGPFEILIDDNPKSIYCDLNGMYQQIPASIEIKFRTIDEMRNLVGDEYVHMLRETQYGYLTYRNSSVASNEFNIYLNIAVKYGWGKIALDSIRIPVRPFYALD